MERPIQFVLLAVVLWSSACDTEAKRRAAEAQKQAEERAIALQAEAAAEARIKQEKAEAEARRKQEVVSNPNAFLATSDLAYFDKGILNSYRQLMKVSVTNRAPYALTGLSGEVEWISDVGEVREKTMFSMRGSISPGDTKSFGTQDGSLNTGTTDSHAHKARVVFKQVKLVDVAEAAP